MKFQRGDKCRSSKGSEEILYSSSNEVNFNLTLIYKLNIMKLTLIFAIFITLISS